MVCNNLPNGDKMIAYDTNGKFIIKKTKNQNIMCNNVTFGDTVVNVSKKCYIPNNILI
jgi:hypothetical protein